MQSEAKPRTCPRYVIGWGAPAMLQSTRLPKLTDRFIVRPRSCCHSTLHQVSPSPSHHLTRDMHLCWRVPPIAAHNNVTEWAPPPAIVNKSRFAQLTSNPVTTSGHTKDHYRSCNKTQAWRDTGEQAFNRICTTRDSEDHALARKYDENVDKL